MLSRSSRDGGERRCRGGRAGGGPKFLRSRLGGLGSFFSLFLFFFLYTRDYAAPASQGGGGQFSTGTAWRCVSTCTPRMGNLASNRPCNACCNAEEVGVKNDICVRIYRRRQIDHGLVWFRQTRPDRTRAVAAKVSTRRESGRVANRGAISALGHGPQPPCACREKAKDRRRKRGRRAKPCGAVLATSMTCGLGGKRCRYGRRTSRRETRGFHVQ
ncbi:hypothetical protein HDV57DRAFT_167767 [Trichoderma longibrachiatum]|uniref:Uncharacterized protein n=1 Tax=Trichoderma longibrachiatum ATCC 18648 TaxID=983965 RepID=A0A2T4CA07_TRILO|nr:hypothetical protein M440DRAFT_260157 [Trichoderma longibrachiatum ATCC 18648]